ncbi:MAG: FAD-dependent oxidoreductase [Pseudomonas sp.]|jgi:D-amino-acid dehydrogenase|uniref:NAD(P)/FAD-dependent oxidoreductase n=1 Tax=Pseudomonas sp. TaxID=306 RepID=UPI002399AF77|nr:FAD-dependent oxidoreductase [Pseudomonas sp.]MDE1198782.1 FAD-dependent oxidoreductase [Pseudomonas sp.]
MDCQTLVLGAGIVGVCCALHLQAAGQSVILLDRDEPGRGTSHGNAGLIERSSMVPYAFPRQWSRLLRYGLNQQSSMRFSPMFLPRLAPWLLQYWRQSSPANLAEAARAMRPLIERCVEEHDVLVEASGMSGLIRAKGWIEFYRDRDELDVAVADATTYDQYGLRYDILDAAQLREREPDLKGVVGGIHWLDPKTVSDPGALVRGYAALFVKRGGVLLQGDARTLRQQGSEWMADSDEGTVHARNVVIAMGPQSAEVFSRFGYRIPLAIKRGYHMHYASQPGAELRHSVIDAQAGFVLAPMARGIRLTTGVEFAASDAPINEIQLRRCETIARTLYPLGERLDAEPWLGRRPCLPDMRPVIGAAPNHEGLWFNFGHAHHGLTLGPVTGRLLAELMTGAPTFTDPAPYSPGRFR